MKIDKQLNYTLLINEPEGHGIMYKNDIEGDIAALLMSAQVLQMYLDNSKETKSKLSGAEKTLMGKNVYHISKGLQAVNALAKSLCDNYEGYKVIERAAQESWLAEQKAEELTELGVLPKEEPK